MHMWLIPLILGFETVRAPESIDNKFESNDNSHSTSLTKKVIPRVIKLQLKRS
jgi:hypothetical protein